MTSATGTAPAPVRAATTATYVAFIGAGLALASWASRIPQVRDGLDLEPSELGLVLLAIAAGSLLALPLSGPVITRIGSRRMVTVMAALLSVSLALVAGGFLVGVLPVVVGLFLLGFANGAWDVAMNVQGAVVERRLQRSIMSRFHAGFSLGTVVGALLGALLVRLDVSVTAHLAAVAVLLAVVVPLSVRRFLPDEVPDEDRGSDAEDGVQEERVRPGVLTAWKEPRTLLVGVFVLAFAFAEGTGNDWIAVAMIDGYDVAPSLGTLAFAAFLAAMTVGRWFGPDILDRHGRVPVVRALAVVGIVGVLLFAFAPSAPLAFAGAMLWGLGTSLGFPVGMSAGADDPERAAARVSVIASIGYCAFLAGPPLVGFLGDHATVLRAVTAVAALLALAALVAGNVRPPARGGDAGPGHPEAAPRA